MTLSTKIPHLRKVADTQQLVVNGKPFLSLAAELQNSSMTSAEYMEPIWQKLVDTNINTVLGCVTWEDIEPVEDQFDFTELEKVILGARKHGLHLVLLWFGSFKNGMLLFLHAYSIGRCRDDSTRTEQSQVSLLTFPLGSRHTLADFLVPNYAKLVVSWKQATCCRSSMKKHARPMQRHSPACCSMSRRSTASTRQ